MAQVTSAMVKELRERTGAGMLDCKVALEKNDGDMEKAIQYLREKGIAKAAKKAGREAKEGKIAVAIDENAKIGVALELNCETDFVGKNEVFGKAANDLAFAAVMDPQAVDRNTLENAKFEHTTIGGYIPELVTKIGENIVLGKFAKIKAENGFVASYSHLGGKIGVIVSFEGVSKNENPQLLEELGKEIAMQIAAANPIAVDRSGVNAELIEKEKEIYTHQLENEGKKPEMIANIVNGKINKYFSEVCLLEQIYVRDSKKKVSDVLDEYSKKLGKKITIKEFVRFQIGE